MSIHERKYEKYSGHPLCCPMKSIAKDIAAMSYSPKSSDRLCKDLGPYTICQNELLLTTNQCVTGEKIIIF